MTQGQFLPAGVGYSTVYADLDFETYSEAGYTWTGEKWKSVGSPQKAGLKAVGSMVYSRHPSTEILCMAYNLKEGTGKKLWTPSMPLPYDLINHVAKGGLIEAHNSAFEHHLWNNVLVPRFGFPPLSHLQQRCSMAKARAFALPGALGDAANAIGTDAKKDKDGTRLINKFCKPRQPTKKDPRRRILPQDDPEDFAKLCAYCLQDIETESELSSKLPDLLPDELEFWLNTQARNYQGVGVRKSEVESCIAILNQAYNKYNLELHFLTQGQVSEASKGEQLREWCNDNGVFLSSFDEEAIDRVLSQEIPPHVRRALEIRQLINSAGVKKVYAMNLQATPEGRLCDLFIYHGARTGRDTGAEVQPQNLVKNGPKIQWCTQCNSPFGMHHDETCPKCGASVCLFAEKRNGGSWSWEAVDHAVSDISLQWLEWIEYIYGDAVLTISGCIRGLFVPAEGKDFIASDYSAIEAVVAACLAGEQWRLDTFNAKKDIYLVSASQITGTSEEAYADYYVQHGAKHPDRQKIGKVAELALGYGGGLGAWRQFDSTENFTDDQVKENIRAWRKASPAIVEMWGGTSRYGRQDFFGLEGMAILAVLNPGQVYTHRDISYGVKDKILFARLPSGRTLTYHDPIVRPSLRWEGKIELTFMGYNTNPKMGPKGWHRLSTFGGRLFENIASAVARDIMAFAVNNLERGGYPILLRVHDELVGEVDGSFGSIEEFEHIMATLPEWAKGWPVRAAGGWRGKRYRKD